MSIWPSPSWDGASEFPQKAHYSPQHICWWQSLPALTWEPRSQIEFRRSLKFSSICKCESVHTTLTQVQMEWMRPALGHSPSVTDTFSRTIHLHFHAPAAPHSSQKPLVSHRYTPPYSQTCPPSSPRTTTSPQQLDTAKNTKQKGIDKLWPIN